MTSVVHVILIVLTLITAILLIGIVLIQKSKGGGLSSQFGGAGNVMGVRQTNSFLEKATWTLAALILVFSVGSAFTMPKVSGAEIRTETKAQATTGENQFDTNTTGVEIPSNEVAAPAAEGSENPVIPVAAEGQTEGEAQPQQ